MTDKQLISRVRVDPRICSGRPYIYGTRIHIAIILDALSEGLAPEEVLEHYPDLETDDLRIALCFRKTDASLATLGAKERAAEALAAFDRDLHLDLQRRVERDFIRAFAGGAAALALPACETSTNPETGRGQFIKTVGD